MPLQGSAEDLPGLQDPPAGAVAAQRELPSDLLALAAAQQLLVDLPPPVSRDWMSLFDRTLFTVMPCLSTQVRCTFALCQPSGVLAQLTQVMQCAVSVQCGASAQRPSAACEWKLAKPAAARLSAQWVLA